MKIKSLVVTAVLAIAILCFGGITQVKADTATDCLASPTIACLTNLIVQLTQQVQVLQNQQGGTTAWCHTFNTNLGVGSTGQEINDLWTALGKDNLNVTAGVGQPLEFSEGEAAAVFQFQQKYGIRTSGWVGPVTRAKLNNLYGCGTITQSITINSVSGPNSLVVGQNGTWNINASAPAGTILTYSVNWGDNTVLNPNVPMANQAPLISQNSGFTHSYSQAGTYTATFTVSDQQKMPTSQDWAKTRMTVVVGQTACTPNWQCGWGPCLNGSQSQTAIDSNMCGLPLSNVNIACPMLARICYPL